MEERLRLLTAKSIARLIYKGQINSTAVLQGLEEMGLDDKAEAVQEELDRMVLVDEYHRALNRG